MLDLETIEDILTEYTEIVIPAMIRQNYHLQLVKGGPDYPHLSEQSHFAHIVNGAFGLVKLLQFAVKQNIFLPNLTETNFRKGLALYTVHDRHKGTDFETLGGSSFAIPLEEMRLEYERLELNRFAEVDEHLMRAVNVHKRSSKQGDLMQTTENQANFLYLLVRIADTIASVTTPDELAKSLTNYLKELGGPFLPNPPGKYGLYYHQLKDVRGVLTNVIHNVVSQQLEQQLGLYELLTFTTGTLYIGPHIKQADRDAIISGVVDGVLASLAELSDDEAIRDGMRLQKFDFEQYVYSFGSVRSLLDIVYQKVVTDKPDAKKAMSEIDGLATKDKSGKLAPDWRDTVEERFQIALTDPKDEQTFNQHWSLVYRYLLFVDTLLRDLAPETDRVSWFSESFNLPQPVTKNLELERGVWGRGGIGKYTLVAGYHFLCGSEFADRTAEALPTEQVLTKLHRYTLEAVDKLDTRAGREVAVGQLGFRQELQSYLQEYLQLSFVASTELTDDSLVSYTTIKRKGHEKKLCSLCNRTSEYGQELRTGILDDFGRIFSNRVLPAPIAPGHNRMWCPICHLEFIMRKLSGMGLPSGAHYKKSRRIYIYILPTFSFTSEHVRLFAPLLRPFHKVTNLNIRDYGKDNWGIPRYWLESQQLDPDWIKKLQTVLEKTADRLADLGGGNYIGERVSTYRMTGQPHYYLITWEKAARESDSDDSRIATRTEAWAKAVFVSTIIAGLTSCKVYVTERPFLPVTDVSKLNATLTLDGAPPAIHGILDSNDDTVSLYGREKSDRSRLETTLDLSAALWTVTTNLKPTKDKDIAKRLARLNVDPLAGAFFYKEFGREHDGQSPYSPLDIACELLLNLKGGELMDLVTKIAEKSLEIALPFGSSSRGKARRYELIFREGISAMRKAQKVIPGMRQLALSGQPPSEDSITELKQLAAGTLLKGLERRQESKRGEIQVRVWGERRSQLVTEFMDILVDDLYLKRANGNFAQLIRLENSLADGIYFYTDRNLSRLWDEHKANKQNNNDQTEETEE